MTTSDILLSILAGLAIITTGMFAAVLSHIWVEIKALRSVRHDDRDHIAELSSRLKMLGLELEDFKKLTTERIDRMKYVFKEYVERNQ